MSVKALITIVIFLSFLIYFTSTLSTIQTGESGILNVTTTNQTTFIATGTQQFGSYSGDICTLAGSENPFIDALQSFVNAIPLINCVTGFTSFIFSYQSIQTGVVWLGFIIFGLTLALVYIAIGLARGGK